MSEMPSLSHNRSQGSLTSVMRAAAAPAAVKVLRVGLVRGGKVIDERILAGHEHVTIGPNERATFVLPARDVPPAFRIFDREGDHYRLQITPQMSGRVADGSSVVELSALRAQASVVKLSGGLGVAHAIRLGPDARGKITVGDFTILFQFVVPAPALGKPQLPTGVKSGMGDVDWRTSVIAAFSFLVHFGAVGSIYSDWMDPVVDDEVETAQILESVKQLPAPPPIEHPKDDSTNAKPVTSAPVVARSEAPTGGARNARGGGGGAAGGGGSSVGDARAHQLAAQMASLELQVLSGLGGSGSATASVLGSSGDLPLGMLDSAAASSLGSRPGTVAGLDLGSHAGAPLRPGVIPRGPLPGDPTPAGPMGPGSAASVRPPPGGAVAVPPPNVIGGEVPNAGGTVAAMAAGFRRCYYNGLNREDPTMRGTVRITAKIGPNGEVLSASAAGGGTLTPTVIGCMRARVASAQFSAPVGGGATLIIPVTVIPQQ